MIPDLNGIRIDCISDADADFAGFLSNCIPARLRLLAINFSSISLTWIKSKFYVDAFSKAAARTSKEVFFSCIDFSAKDLQTVVRAAHNAERIVFRCCCIHCSSDLDFGADLSYNTKFISFQQWGDTDCEERTTDWKSDPSCFSLILSAINNSGLKNSLQELNIYGNQTLYLTKVQAELDDIGMSHISVVEEWDCPLSS